MGAANHIVRLFNVFQAVPKGEIFPSYFTHSMSSDVDGSKVAAVERY